MKYRIIEVNYKYSDLIPHGTKLLNFNKQS